MNARWALSSIVTAALVPLAGVNICLAQGDQVRIRLETTDTDGNPISTAGLGDDFLVRTFVQDLRDTAPLDGSGVFAAYMDVTYPTSLVSLTGPISYADPYMNLQTGDTTIAGLVDEVGAFDGPDPLGKDEFLFFTLAFSADALGDAVFASDPAEDLPKGFVLVYGFDDEVPPELVDYGTATLSIVPEPSAATIAMGAILGLVGWRRRRRARSS